MIECSQFIRWTYCNLEGRCHHKNIKLASSLDATYSNSCQWTLNSFSNWDMQTGPRPTSPGNKHKCLDQAPKTFVSVCVWVCVCVCVHVCVCACVCWGERRGVKQMSKTFKDLQLPLVSLLYIFHLSGHVVNQQVPGTGIVSAAGYFSSPLFLSSAQPADWGSGWTLGKIAIRLYNIVTYAESLTDSLTSISHSCMMDLRNLALKLIQ